VGPLAVRTSGDPGCSPLLLVHPINLRGDAWLDLLPLLRDHYCVIPDLRGHGTSTAQGPFGWAHWVDDCLTAADAFIGDRPFHAMGCSLGGTIAVGVALRRPGQVRSVMTMGSAARSGTQKTTVLQMLDRYGARGMFDRAFREFTFGPNTSAEVVDRAIEMANPNSVEVVRHIWLATQRTDIRAVAGDIDCPVTVLTGEYDTTCPPERGRELAAVTAGDFLGLRGVGHMPMLEVPLAIARQWRHHLERTGDEVAVPPRSSP
jgi:pimeloyl-ACP methyl ester carboxylesterase